MLTLICCNGYAVPPKLNEDLLFLQAVIIEQSSPSEQVLDKIISAEISIEYEMIRNISGWLTFQGSPTS